MARPQYPTGSPKNAHAFAASTAAVGDLISYTAPTGKSAIILGARTNNLNAAVQIQAKFRSGGNEIALSDTAAGADIVMATLNSAVTLEAGEVFALEIDAALAATTADGYFSLMEYDTV